MRRLSAEALNARHQVARSELGERIESLIDVNLEKVRALYYELAKSDDPGLHIEAARLGYPLIEAEYAAGEATQDFTHMHEAIGWWMGLLSLNGEAAESITFALDLELQKSEGGPPVLRQVLLGLIWRER